MSKISFVPSDLPQLPPYIPTLKPSIVPHLPDSYLAFILPAITYWVVSLTFHYIDVKGYCSNYRLHTPAEYLKRNRASKADVIKVALFQQVCQCLLGALIAKDELSPSAEYDVAVWARRVRLARRVVPGLLSVLGIDSTRLAKAVSGISPSFGAILLGGVYVGPSNITVDVAAESSLKMSGERVAPFDQGEMIVAELLYYVLVPTLKFFVALILADTWQYVTHRILHANKFLYKHIHALHHQVYVSYAYGAFYNHPIEAIVVDMLGFPVCLAMAGLNTNESTLFATMWTIKIVMDHCGYDFPYSPWNLLTPHAPLFHDLHHQSWGMKHNFSNYTPFWDWALGTIWRGDDGPAQQRYARGRASAEKELMLEKHGKPSDVSVMEL